mgnify:CR=1 FL=1
MGIGSEALALVTCMSLSRSIRDNARKPARCDQGTSDRRVAPLK